MNRHTTTTLLLLALLGAAIGYWMQSVEALPGGATITFNSTSGVPSATPSNRTDPHGTITTIILNGVQQDQYWKGYVGNITGKLSLDDATGFTIYDWPISLTKNGEVYVSRSNAPVFSSVSCASIGNITNEEAYYGMVTTQSDDINKTFNATSHQTFLVGAQSIGANTCKSTATYRNDLPQALDGNQFFQEVLLQDSSANLLYVTMINASVTGFDNRPYDFQMIVPESLVNTSTTYYFYTELG